MSLPNRPTQASSLITINVIGKFELSHDPGATGTSHSRAELRAFSRSYHPRVTPGVRVPRQQFRELGERSPDVSGLEMGIEGRIASPRGLMLIVPSSSVEITGFGGTPATAQQLEYLILMPFLVYFLLYSFRPITEWPQELRIDVK
jgi:hypothetical protein